MQLDDRAKLARVHANCTPVLALPFQTPSQMRPSEIAHAHASTACTRSGQLARGSPSAACCCCGTTSPVWICLRPQYETLGLPVSTHFVGLWLCEDGGPGAMTVMAAVSHVLTAATLSVCQPLLPVSDGGSGDANDTKKPHAWKSSVPKLEHHTAVYARNMTASAPPA
ncbi:hypothetical protein COCCADRAFT_30060 [Bipolaris zeicola 26-R-13]|uniref:Uncharacterized protein n=1 Tax=Cochliobolus carbonum (strain 26-R-13) TaxID=930089 RepID=W6XN74_COCC2|nr:uncharacterized protein COCCADRAFT_30060 [Bipolaris zeicola 26-R-13]EUC28742.1 hypothetical protein COCCADRAFT_30060 [Bipolaris zeicola 26-R-13]